MSLRYFHFCRRLSDAIGVILYSIFLHPLRTAAGQVKIVKRLNSGVLMASVIAVVATSVPVVVQSNASWKKSEWDSASLGTLSCTTGGTFKTRAAGRLLGGSLLPLNLDAAASVKGMTVTNDGTATHPDPSNATGLGGDAYANPLTISALGAINLPLTGTALSNFLRVPLNTGVGLINQYAKAASNGQSLGASGVINDSGAVMTDNDTDGNPPTLGTLSLSTLVSSLTGKAVSDIVSGVADLDLQIGAVAGRASLDACADTWKNDIDANLKRSYAIAGLKASIDSPAVAAVSTTAGNAITNIQNLLNGLAGNSGVLSSVTGGLTGVLGTALGVLSLGDVTMTGPTVTTNLSAVTNLLTSTIADDHDLVSLNLGTGKVSVDLAALIGQAYGGQGFNGTQAHGLNGLPPNTQLVLNSTVTNALVAALTQALDNWVGDVVDAVNSAISAARVQTKLTIGLKANILGVVIPVASVNVPIDASLKQLMDGTATLTPTLSLLGGTCDNLLTTPVPCTIATVVNPLVGGIVGALTSGVGPLVGNTLNSLIFADGSPVKTLGSTLSDATAPIVTMLSTLLNGYLGVDGLVSLQANLENDPTAGNNPDPDPALTYTDWESGPDKVPDHRYDVAALGIGILNATGTSGNVNLELGRGSVGVNCQAGGPLDHAGACSGY